MLRCLAVRAVRTARLPAAQRRRLCAAAEADSLAPLRASVEGAWDELMDADWTDADESLHALTDKAQSVIDDYRAVHTQHMLSDPLYDRVRQLYVAKEAAKISDAYSEFVEVVIRDHEDMIGTFGDNTEIPPNGADRALKMMDDYVDLVTSLDEKDKLIRRKLEDELGRKMVLIKMMLSVDNFSASMVPVAGDRLVPQTK